MRAWGVGLVGGRGGSDSKGELWVSMNNTRVSSVVFGHPTTLVLFMENLVLFMDTLVLFMDTLVLFMDTQNQHWSIHKQHHKGI